MTILPFANWVRRPSAVWHRVCRPVACAAIIVAGFGFGVFGAVSSVAVAKEPLPWQRDGGVQNQNGSSRYRDEETYRQAQGYQAPDPYRPGSSPYGGDAPPRNDAYRPPQPENRYESPPRSDYRDPPPRYVQPYRPPESPDYSRDGANDRYPADDDRRYGNYDGGRYDDRGRDNDAHTMPDASNTTYSENEVIDAGHRFFGSLSSGLAKAVQWAFKKSGRPNGYILGEDAGGAFIAGLRYGEGKLYTKNYGARRVFWQGPSIGYDFGGDGNRTMTLVYNLRSPGDVFRRFGGVQGSAYLVGGVSVQFLTADDITLAPIRTGVGLRLGANIGYLKYTRRPTWNPF